MRSWPLREQIAFFESELELPLVEEPESGKLFPKSQRARDVRDRLLAYARRKGVTIVTDTLVTGIRAVEPIGWIVERHDGDPLEADAVILATGGLSVPNTGSDGRGLRDRRGSSGTRCNPTYAALTPLRSTRSGTPDFAHLSGRLAARSRITARSDAREAQATGGFLFTHQGYSGPSVLDVSHVAVRSLDEARTAARDHRAMDAAARQRVGGGAAAARDAHRARGGRRRAAPPPRRGARAAAGVESEPPARAARPRRTPAADRDARARPAAMDRRRRLQEGRGHGRRRQSRGDRPTHDGEPPAQGLFLCGEMLDAFGPIGGYNFLWAWATGRAAGHRRGANDMLERLCR